ncbi:MAG: crossover junction endodeoxyribonuclease RuvC [Deltaproteobacteria bacterium]|nr:crossover junction endodeoxyribonuclease RuvC [Deltaproteobacteria bacterium]
MKVLGIDPGSLVTGYGIIGKNGTGIVHIDSGVIAPSPKKDFPSRLLEIYTTLIKVIREFSPDEIAIEEVFFAQNVRSALKLGEARGVALLAVEGEGVPLSEYSAREVKQAITGYGQADKQQVQKMVQRLLKLPEPAAIDASDALAIALCHMQSRNMRRYDRAS